MFSVAQPGRNFHDSCLSCAPKKDGAAADIWHKNCYLIATYMPNNGSAWRKSAAIVLETGTCSGGRLPPRAVSYVGMLQPFHPVTPVSKCYQLIAHGST